MGEASSLGSWGSQCEGECHAIGRRRLLLIPTSKQPRSMAPAVVTMTGQIVRTRAVIAVSGRRVTAGNGKKPIKFDFKNNSRDGLLVAMRRSPERTLQSPSFPSTSIQASSGILPVPNLSLMWTTSWMPSNNAPSPRPSRGARLLSTSSFTRPVEAPRFLRKQERHVSV